MDAPSGSVTVHNSNPSIIDKEVFDILNPLSDWVHIDPKDHTMISGNSRLIRMKIGLLGDRARRRTADRYLNLLVDSEAKEAFTNLRIPTLFSVWHA